MQVAMSGLLAAPKAEAVYRNASVVSGSGLAGHPRVVYDVFRTAGEWWADFSKAETIDGGICQVKAACAVDSGCDGFVYRIRDGAGLLGRGLRVMDKASPATKSKVNRFARKAPRGVLMYVKRGRGLHLGKLDVEAGTVVGGGGNMNAAGGGPKGPPGGGGPAPPPPVERVWLLCRALSWLSCLGGAEASLASLGGTRSKPRRR